MTSINGQKSKARLDDVDWDILDQLQHDGRVSFSELGRRVSLSAPAVTERVRRLEEAGVIAGYHARVDPGAVGAPIAAIVRVRTSGTTNYNQIYEDLQKRPEIRQCHHVTGDDCLVIHIACPDMGRLEDIVSVLASYGSTTTSVMFSSPFGHQPVRRELVERSSSS